MRSKLRVYDSQKGGEHTQDRGYKQGGKWEYSWPLHEDNSTYTTLSLADHVKPLEGSEKGKHDINTS